MTLPIPAPRSTLLLGAPLLLTLLAACTAQDAERMSLDDAFQAAATAHDVPRDLLVALAYSQTRFDEPMEGEHEHGGIRGLGIMDLGAGSPAVGPDVTRSAARLGATVEDVATDRALNIEVSASELRFEADRLEEERGIAIERIDDWVEVVGWYSGSEDGGAQRSYARQVYRWIEGGLRERDPVDNRWIVIPSRELDIPLLDLAAVSGGAGDSALADNVVSAATCNYTNASRGSSSIDMVVVHTAQGSYSGTYNWFQNCSAGASAHYVLRASDGEITQMVTEADTAWHAGDSGTNARSVSIELEGYIEDPDRWFTDAAYTSLASLIADISARQGIAVDRTHIIGHMEVPGCSYPDGGGRSCHTDPGSGFDWDELIGRLAGASGSSESSGSSSSSGSSISGTTGAVGDLVGFVRVDSVYNTASVISGATVTVSTGQSAITDARGYFQVTGVPSGSVTLTVSAAGYAGATDTAEIDAGITNWNSVAVFVSSGGSSGSSMAPSGGVYESGPDVTLSWLDSGADSFDVQIYWYDGSDWNNYYTYTTYAASKTFWPTVRDAQYAWAVRSVSGGSRSEWSAVAYFAFGG